MKKIFFIFLFAFCGTLSAGCDIDCITECENNGSSAGQCEASCGCSTTQTAPNQNCLDCVTECENNGGNAGACEQSCGCGNSNATKTTAPDNCYQDCQKGGMDSEHCFQECRKRPVNPTQNSTVPPTNSDSPCARTPTNVNN